MTGPLRFVGWFVPVMALIAACTAPAVSPTPLASPASPAAVALTAPPSSTPSPTPSPSPLPSVFADPTSSAPAAPSPTSVAARWTKARRVNRTSCDELTAVIDGAGGYHVAAGCEYGIPYVFSSVDDATWTESAIVPPAHRLDMEPRLAIDGDTLYIGVTRIGDGADCGLPADVGFFLRSRTLPDGAWSDPVRIGARGDRLQDLQVVDGVVHAIVSAEGDGPVSYESRAGATHTRVVLPGAHSAVVRVGHDGKARVAYATEHRIVYATVTGGELARTIIAADKRTNMSYPELALGPDDHADLKWIQSDQQSGPGCGTSGPGPLDGTYLGTDRGGEWATMRVRRSTFGGSLTMDPGTGQLYMLMPDDSGTLHYLAQRKDGSWSSAKVPGMSAAYESLILVDLTRGRLVVFGAEGDGIYIVTKG